MTEKSRLRQRISVPNRRSRPPQPSPSSSSSPRRRNHATPRPSRPIKILQRCNSEPTIFAAGGDDEYRNMTAPDASFFRPQTCTDVFSSAESLPPPSPQKFEGYSEDAKVVVNVIVEGSPGPIRTMVKLGSSVEETIRLVIKKYGEEGRSPRLDKDAASIFELHLSYFSLESLNKSDVIGEVGSRSFYLRKGNGDCNSNRGDIVSASLTSESVSARENSIATPSPFIFLPAFITRKIHKIVRRTRKIWKILGCMHCSG